MRARARTLLDNGPLVIILAGHSSAFMNMKNAHLSLVIAILFTALWPAGGTAAVKNADVDRAVNRGLEWLAATRRALGSWSANNERYPTSMTALSGIALLCEGSTTTQGKYAANIRRTVDYLVSRSRKNGLIGDPTRDDRYTYGHGFSMLFLSQVLGEEEDAERRAQLIDVLTRAVVLRARPKPSRAVGVT